MPNEFFVAMKLAREGYSIIICTLVAVVALTAVVFFAGAPLWLFWIVTVLLWGLFAATILAAQLIDNFILQPLLYSNSVNAHPLEIFIVILMAGQFAGVVGMLLAIPTYTVLRVIGKEFFTNFKLVRKLTEKI